jgi:uncharacterized protein (TIGR02996 family)
MPRQDELLLAVLASPDDDLPRLVYADALEEAGDVARAEFIRVQIELTRTPERVDLKAREAALLAVNGKKWLAPLRRAGEALENRTTHGQFRRGFVEIVWTPAVWFLNRAKQLFARTPCRELRVTRADVGEIHALLRSRYVARLRTLDLSDRKIGDAGATDIAACRRIAPLKCLRLRACNCTDVGAYCLAYAPFDWPLQELDVSLNRLSPVGVLSLQSRFGHDVVKFEPPPPTD